MRDSKVVLRHGGYKRLISYQKSVIVFDATRCFCDRFLSRRDRTYDQMIQAARSGKQNIIEGSQASGTSKEMELKLTSVARASLEELLEDYLDFLRGIGAAEWARDHPYAVRLRAMNRVPDTDYDFFRRGIEHADSSICVNVIVGLVKVTCYLLDRQIMALDKEFLEKGGLRERMTRLRLERRGRHRS